MCELRHHPCDDFVTHKIGTLSAKWIRQPARVALSRETIYAADAGSGRAPPLSRRCGAHEEPVGLREGGVYQFPSGNNERPVTFCIPDHTNTPIHSRSAGSTDRF